MGKGIEILEQFDLLWFQRENKISHFCFELTAMHCSQPDYPRDREYCTYDPPSRRTPPPNSFTATYEDYKKYMFREDITEQVMQNFDAPVISYEWFVEDQDETMLRIQEHYGIKANFREENKKEIINNSLKNQYKKLFNKIDRLVYLKAPNFNNIFKWRLLQEQKMKLTSKNKKTMSKSQVKEFIMFYERITKNMMRSFSKISDLTIFLDGSHRSKRMKTY